MPAPRKVRSSHQVNSLSRSRVSRLDRGVQVIGMPLGCAVYRDTLSRGVLSQCAFMPFEFQRAKCVSGRGERGN